MITILNSISAGAASEADLYIYTGSSLAALISAGVAVTSARSSAVGLYVLGRVLAQTLTVRDPVRASALSLQWNALRPATSQLGWTLVSAVCFTALSSLLLAVVVFRIKHLIWGKKQCNL